MKKIIVAGAGASGLSCAIYLARAGYTVDVFSNEENAVSCMAEAPLVMNYPGFPEGISGYDLLELFTSHAVNSGAVIHTEGIARVNDGIAVDTAGNSHSFDEFVMATGVKPREFTCRGIGLIPVHTCAVCDGGLYSANDAVAVIGGGDTAVNSSLYLSNIVGHVHMIVRKDRLRATNLSAFSELMKKSNVTVLYNTSIDDIVPVPGKYFTLYDSNHAVISENIHAIFSCIGYDVNDIPVDDGVFIWRCGDCIEEHHQISVAVGSGARTALEIIKNSPFA